MLKLIRQRLLLAIPLLLVLSFLVFGLIHLAPFNAVDAIIKPTMSTAEVHVLQHRYGIDKPFMTQYVLWLMNFVTGHFGHSIINQQDIGQALAERIPNTVMLVLPSYLTATIIAVILGLIGGRSPQKLVGRFIDTLTAIGLATPSFWIALLLLYFLGYVLNLFPIFGMGSTAHPLGVIWHMVLPYLTLVIAFFPETTRYVRSKTMTEYRQDYVMVQRAFGASERSILFRHVLPNVLLPVVTQLGQSLPLLITGAMITETVFSWPGVGAYMMDASVKLDYPVILAVMLLSAFLVVVGNLLADISYALVDPRVRR
ncbi:ABC transporter permease [Weissella confusa]|uniref:ABC transporter permease n=1 Tax=Weissella confusa TaxID=1583 RepID=UPI0022FDB601|nr:ABC transporter permease [Weissella confusa]MDA5458423.1 Dipeptide transport system permease protein DppB [Weissella confusa]